MFAAGRLDIRRGLVGLFCLCLLITGAVQAATLDEQVAKAFRKIGIGPEQAEAFSRQHEAFLKSRNMQMRRVLNSRSGEEVSVMAKKKARLAAKRAVRKMQGILSELQMKYYGEYLELANEQFLRDAGLR